MPLPQKFPRSSSAKKKKPKAPKANERVLANRYTVVRRLGTGNFGTAWIVTDKRPKDDKEALKALKEIPVGDLQPDETIDAVHEACLLRNLDHPGIVKFHDSFIDDTFFCIVTEYCEGGDLDQKIAEARKKGRTIPEAQVMEWLIQLLLALQYMHDRRVLHRDLKARNIFLRNNVIKVGDFGISRILMGTTDMASTFVGTPYYMSPEVLKHEGYNSKSDVWSIGCILYEMCSLHHAFEGQSLMGVMYKIVEGSLPEWPSKYSNDLKKVFENLLIKDPAKRPSASEALKMGFIAKQMEELKNTMVVKHHQKEQKEVVRNESQQLWTDMKKETKIDQIRRESEEKKWKNMSPRERMRLKKQQQADEDAKRLRVVALQQQMDNKMKYEEIKRSNNPYETHFDFEGTTKEAAPRKGPAFTDYRALEDSVRPQEEDSDEDSDDSEENEADTGTVKERFSSSVRFNKTSPISPGSLAGGSSDRLSKTAEFPKSRETIGEFSRTFRPDERPITPMKNRMVYDVEHSTLDFDDGIPENAALAETYYSQFEDFEKEEDGDDDADAGGDEAGDPGEGTLVSRGSDGTLGSGGDEDVEDLINCMKNALDKSDTLKSQTLTENATMSAFGPVAREMKIKNLKLEAANKLGEEEFNRAYIYLKEARFGNKNGRDTPDENNIMKGLSKMVKNANDCFIVDQLLFLEAQAELGS